MSRARLFRSLKALDVDAVSEVLAADPALLRAVDDRKRTPLHRLGTEEEVAAGILFLLDPARAAYVTGTVLEVSGGWTAYGYV